MTPPVPSSADGNAALRELALDLRWSWDHGTDEIGRELDPALWHHLRHPNAVLQAVSRDLVERRLADPAFL